jgi:hypothetical protein
MKRVLVLLVLAMLFALLFAQAALAGDDYIGYDDPVLTIN